MGLKDFLRRIFLLDLVQGLELTQDFEIAHYTREGMIWDREMLEKGPQPVRYSR